MKRTWTREQSKERFPLALSPMGWSLLYSPTQATLRAMTEKLGLRSFRPEDITACIDSYVYTREGFFDRQIFFRLRPSTLIKFSFSSGLFLGMSLLGSVFYRFQLKNLFLHLHCSFHHKKNIETLVLQWESQGSKMIEDLRHDPMGTSPHGSLSFEEFLDCRKILESASAHFFYQDFNVYFFKSLMFQWLLGLLQLRGLTKMASQEFLLSFTQGLDSNLSVRMALDYTRIPREKWLKTYCHLTDNWDIKAPTLGENPELWTKSFMNESELLSNHERRTQIRSNLKKELEALFSQRTDLIRIFDLFEKIVIIDEDLRAYSSLQYPVIKKLFSRVTQTPAWSAASLDPDAIYYLTIDEVEEALKNQDFSRFQRTIQVRKEKFHIDSRTTPPRRYRQKGSEWKGLLEMSTQAESILKGLSLSQGQAQAPVLLVEKMEDLKDFTPGCILVVRAPTPTYAPYYAQCGGILSETGGLLSHGALVAREFGIPMISNIPCLFEKLENKKWVRMNADLGEVGW